MEIVKYVKVIVPSNSKKVLRNKLWHMLAGKNKYRRVSVRGLSPASPPSNFRLCLGNDTRQADRSSLVMGSGAEPRPNTVLV